MKRTKEDVQFDFLMQIKEIKQVCGLAEMKLERYEGKDEFADVAKSTFSKLEALRNELCLLANLVQQKANEELNK